MSVPESFAGVPLVPEGRVEALAPQPTDAEAWPSPEGIEIKRLYHTDNATQDIEVSVSGHKVNFTVRTFEQLPLD